MVLSNSEKGCLSAPRRVAVLRALALGDLLCAVPALRALRRAWPQTEITLIGLPQARQWATRFSAYVDGFVEFPGWPGLPEREPQLDRIPAFLTQVQAEQYDLALQLHGSGTIVNSLVALFKAQTTAGFFPPGYYRPNPLTFVPWPAQGLEIHRLLSLVDHLGLPRAGDHLAWPLVDEDFSRLDEILVSAGVSDEPYVVIHPGASTPLRRWPVDRFAVVGERLAAKSLRLLITGIENERALAQQLVERVGPAAVNLCGRTDLGTLGALVARAALVLCNDTGISHVAASLQTPSVVISTGDNPSRWAPIDTDLHRVLCRPDRVSVDEAWQSVLEQLSRRGSGRRAVALNQDLSVAV